MKVVVFGSTGGTGLACCSALIAAGHEVTAFARNPTKLSTLNGIRIVQGDVMNKGALPAAMAGQDAAIVSLGNSQNPFAMLLGAKRTTPHDVCEVGTANIIAAMNEPGIKRLIVVTAFGIGSSRPQLPFSFKLFYRTVLREHMADKEKQEALVKASGLDWMIVQPVGLTDSPATGKYLASHDGKIRAPQMSRADVAAYILTIVQQDQYTHETISLSG